MNILALSHGHSLGGAQISTLEFLEHLRKEVDIRVATCEDTEEGFLESLRDLNIGYRLVPCSMSGNIIHMSINTIEDWLKWADIMWVTDEVLTPPHVKNVKNIPVVVHLHSYPLLCPWWGLLYGMRDVCYEGCSVGRIVRCKQLFNKELSKLGIIDTVKSNLYQVLDLIKGPFDYFNWRRTVKREVLDSIDAFIAISNFVKRVHEELLPVGDKPIEVIYNPVTYPLKYLERFKELEINEQNEEDLIVYASGSNPVKGPHLILKALKIILYEGHDIKLLMFSCRNTWVEKHIMRLGLEKNVICMGRESFDKLYEAMYKAKAVVMPSIWPEPFGRVPVEANRLGTLAVVTNRGGLPETIIQSVTGFIAEVSPEDLAMKIKQTTKSKKRRQLVRDASLSKLNPRDSVDALLKFFESI